VRAKNLIRVIVAVGVQGNTENMGFKKYKFKLSPSGLIETNK
jgi:dihydrolipoamide dehydrogenase